MKTKYLAIALALVVAAGAGTAVWAHAHTGGAHGMMFGHHMGWIARKLDQRLTLALAGRLVGMKGHGGLSHALCAALVAFAGPKVLRRLGI